MPNRKPSEIAASRPATAGPRPEDGGPRGLESRLSEATQRALRLHMGGQCDQAARLYQQILNEHPNVVAALAGLGQIRGQRGDLVGGLNLLRRAVALDDQLPHVHINMAELLQLLNRPKEAITSLNQAIELKPDNVRAHCMAAGIHDRMNRTDDAMACVERALCLEKGHVNAHILHARLLRKRGNLREARDELQAILAAGVEAGFYRQRASWELGTVLDRLGEWDAAFEAFRISANEKLRDPRVPYLDRRAWPNRIAGYRNAIGPAAEIEIEPGHGPRLAFLVGFPRSGTTMTEQIMAAHPSIVTSDEQELVGSMRRELASMFPELPPNDTPAQLARLDTAGVRSLRDSYWRKVEDVANGLEGGSTFIDKLPLNLVDLPLINRVFPDAAILVSIRDPRDACLSCFMQEFQLNEAMIHFLSLKRCAVFYDQVMGLWLHLRDRLKLDHVEIRYEDTVSDLRQQAGRMLHFLGLPWCDRLMAFHEQARSRAISTPSYEAVTQPVHSRSVGRWRNYRRYLDSAMRHLDMYIREFGYS